MNPSSSDSVAESAEATPAGSGSTRNGGQPLREHLHCASCGYDLHRLSRESRCPECGWPVADTLESLYNSRSWLVAIKSGVLMLLAGHYVLVGSILLVPLLPLGLCFFVLLVLGGAVEIGTRHPRAPERDHGLHAPASYMGVGMIAGVGVIVMLFAPRLGFMLATFGLASFLVGLVKLWMLLATILDRGLSDEASRFSRLLAWAVGVNGALTILVLLVIGLNITGAPALDLGILAGLVVAGGWLILLLFSLVTLDFAHRALRTAASIAWLAEQPDVNRQVEPAS